jgi:hypothetical protein
MGLPSKKQQDQRTALTQAVVRVGDGRGFVFEDKRGKRVVITAGHCLPHLPVSHPFSYTHERTYRSLLGPLGAKPTVHAECLFADPVADIAALGSPDHQELSDEAEAYEELVMGVTPLPVADAPKQGSKRHKLQSGGQVYGSIKVPTPRRATALLLSLGGKWIECSVTRWGPWLSVEEEVIESGMSGSPIISMAGQAIGVMSTGGLNPVLLEALPPRILPRS